MDTLLNTYWTFCAASTRKKNKVHIYLRLKEKYKILSATLWEMGLSRKLYPLF